MSIAETSYAQVNAIANLPPDLAIMKMDNDSIQSLAAARPRDYDVIKADLQSQLKAFPVLATESIYNKPVGRDDDKCTNCGAVCFRDKKTKERAAKCYKCGCKDIKEGEQKFARNLSIRAAETLAEVCGYNRVRSDVTPVDEHHVKVEATFTDYQRGRIWQDGGIVSKAQKRRDGGTEIVPDDRFYNVVVKAEKSKYVREVINRSMPAGLKAWFWEECERIIDDLLDDKTVEKIVGQFSGKGIGLDKLEMLLGTTLAKGWTKEHRKTLLGVWNALKDGETSIDEIMGAAPRPEEPATAQQPAGGASASDLSNPKAKSDQHPANTDWLEAFKSDLAACNLKGEVGKLEEHAIVEGKYGVLSDDDVSTLKAMAERRRDEIGAGRGSKSNQGTLV